MKTSKLKKSTETVNSCKGEKLVHAKEVNLKEPKTEKTNMRKESPKSEAVGSENEGNKNNVDIRTLTMSALGI